MPNPSPIQVVDHRAALSRKGRGRSNGARRSRHAAQLRPLAINCATRLPPGRAKHIMLAPTTTCRACSGRAPRSRPTARSRVMPGCSASRQARDMVMAGAFRQTLVLRGVRRIPMLFQHDPAEPIGIWQELGKTPRPCARPAHSRRWSAAREVLALMKSGAIDGLSIGFKTVKGRLDPRTRIRKLEQLDLWEFRSSPSRCSRARASAPSRMRARRSSRKATGTSGCSAAIRASRLRERRPSRTGRRSSAMRRRARTDRERRTLHQPPPAAARGSIACSNVGRRRSRGANAASAVGSPTARSAPWPTARPRSPGRRVERFAPTAIGTTPMYHDKPEWIAHQRKRWLRPDADRWMRPDAHRWMGLEAQRWRPPDRKLRPQPQPDERGSSTSPPNVSGFVGARVACVAQGEA